MATYHQLLKAMLAAGVPDPDKYLRTPQEMFAVNKAAEYLAYYRPPQRMSVARWLAEHPTDGKRADLDERKMTS